MWDGIVAVTALTASFVIHASVAALVVPPGVVLAIRHASSHQQDVGCVHQMVASLGHGILETGYGGGSCVNANTGPISR